MRNTKAGLAWIVGILRKENIAFEVDGGLAAELYGTKRELADIDLNVPEEDFYKIVPFVKEYIVYGPAYYEDEHWKLLMMSLKYAGQNIDIGAVETMQYFDAETNEWKHISSDLSDVRMMEYMGMQLPVINEIKLMIYKQQLGRGVDRKDVAGMEEQLFQ